MSVEDFERLIARVTDVLADEALEPALAETLNARFPAAGEDFAAIAALCRRGIDDGWLCGREAGGIRYGRVFKPSPALGGFSVDVVLMKNVKGPHHRHPEGEIDMVMPVTTGAEFDGHGEGWCVYGAGSAHHPTVTGGEAVVLYLLPGGAIEFTGN